MVENIIGMFKVHEKIYKRDIVGILIGSFITALAYNIFIIPSGILSGGVTGVAMLFYYTLGWDVSLLYLLLNIPILIIGMKYVSKRFAYYSILGTLSMTIFLFLTKTIQLQLDDVLLLGIYGGIFAGIGTGLVFRSKASMGGTDIIAVVLKKFFGYSLGEVSLAFNVLIIGTFAFLGNIQLAMYTMISIFVTSKMMDVVEVGWNTKKSVTIVSDYSEEISQMILTNLNRGVTLLEGKGAFSGSDKKVILCYVNRTEVIRLKEIVGQVDSQAFMAIADAREVMGIGFNEIKSEY